jgi:exopolysaccharide biosynthesis polyprenyl glycosylphosphotransferase
MSSAGIQLAFPTLAIRSSNRVAEGFAGGHKVRRFAPIVMVSCEVLLDGGAAALAVQLGWLIASIAGSHNATGYRQPGIATTLFIAFGVLALLERMGAYRPAKSLLFVRETAMLLAASLTVVSGLGVFSAAGMIAVPLHGLFASGATLFLCLLIEKTSMHLMEQRLHESGATSTKVAIYGTGLACRRLYSTLINSPKLGLWPAVVVDRWAAPTSTVVESGYRLRQSAEVLSQELNCATLRAAGVEKVLIIANSFSDFQLQEAMASAACCDMPTEICAGDVASFGSPIEHDDVDGLVMWRSRRDGLPDIYSMVKRAFDAVAAAILIVLFSPILAAVSIAIKITSPGEALFRQERIGRNGKRFTILKFRSMHKHACGDGFSPTSGTDARISRVGRILRKTSLDELPQLFNVLRGEMSLVGPRPEMPFIAEKYTALESRRLEVVPGITGLWQISAHRKELIHNNMQYDLYYVRHRGFFMDLAILIHTVGFAMKGL